MTDRRTDTQHINSIYRASRASRCSNAAELRRGFVTSTNWSSGWCGMQHELEQTVIDEAISQRLRAVFVPETDILSACFNFQPGYHIIGLQWVLQTLLSPYDNTKRRVRPHYERCCVICILRFTHLTHLTNDGNCSDLHVERSSACDQITSMSQSWSAMTCCSHVFRGRHLVDASSLLR